MEHLLRQDALSSLSTFLPLMANSTQYLPLRDFDEITKALNFDTADCHIIGGCDVYTTKAAGGDKKLYKTIEKSLESQYASVLSFSASLSSQQAQAAGPSLNLSRASPFGPFSHISSRRTFAYLIATLNASHPDYDFSHILRPSDFKREKNCRKIMGIIDNTLYNLRPNPSNAFSDEPAHWSTEVKTSPTLQSSERWNPQMWCLIDKEMVFKDCSIYRYAPEEDPYDGEEGALWSHNYFFFNKAKKRVCYLYLRGISMLECNSGLKTPMTPETPGPRSKRCVSSTWSLDEELHNKRAKFWLGDRAADARLVGADDDERDATGRQATGDNNEQDIEDEESRFMAFSSTDDGGPESPCNGRDRSSSA